MFVNQDKFTPGKYYYLILVVDTLNQLKVFPDEIAVGDGTSARAGGQL